MKDNEPAEPSRYRMAQLTPRELRVSCLVAAGLTNSAIAEVINVRPATVASHLMSIFRKLRVKRRAQLAMIVGFSFGRKASAGAQPSPPSNVSQEDPGYLI
jgi:DNA-binding CsgD family transcriptional regulator